MKNVLKKMILAASMSVFAFSAMAVQVTPSKISVPKGVKLFTVSVANNEKDPRTYEVKLLNWDKNGIRESTDIMSSRPQITVPPGQVAKVRFQFLEKKETPLSFYHVVLKDITPRKKDEVGARTVIEMHLPVFVRGEGDITTDLDLKEGVLTNKGTGHIQITEVKGQRTVLYVLPGETVKVPGAKTLEDIKYNTDVQ